MHYEPPGHVKKEIGELPDDVRNILHVLIADSRYTYDDIRMFLKVKGFDISKITLGLYSKKFYQEVNEAQKLLESIQTMKQAELIYSANKNKKANPDTL